jgi:hypothetical protein
VVGYSEENENNIISDFDPLSFAPPSEVERYDQVVLMKDGAEISSFMFPESDRMHQSDDQIFAKALETYRLHEWAMQVIDRDKIKNPAQLLSLKDQLHEVIEEFIASNLIYVYLLRARTEELAEEITITTELDTDSVVEGMRYNLSTTLRPAIERALTDEFLIQANMYMWTDALAGARMSLEESHSKGELDALSEEEYEALFFKHLYETNRFANPLFFYAQFFVRKLLEDVKPSKLPLEILREFVGAKSEQSEDGRDGVDDNLVALGTSETSRKKRKTRKCPPQSIPQQTFKEAFSVAVAITDGPTMRRWEPIIGEVALRHAIPDKALQTKFTTGKLPDWWAVKPSICCDDLENLLKTFTVSTVLLLHNIVAWVAEEGRATAEIDTLIKLLGWSPRSVKERQEMRRRIWAWMLAFDALEVHGKRPGQYRDRLTRKVIDLTSKDPLIVITGTRYADNQQMSLDHSEIPLEISWVAGEWLEQHRHDKRIVTYYGNIKKLTGIPAGKPSGAWAQSIGLALNQRWREMASDADIKSDGNGQHKTARFSRHFTRFELLDMFQVASPIPSVQDILNSTNPNRAIKYWDEAIATLQDIGVIGKKRECYNQVDPMGVKREGWQTFWLYNQRLDIRPNPEGTEQINEIASRARTARKAIFRRRSGKRTATV